MRINYVKTKGFRKFKEVFETNLYDITNISGKNRSGKSNILYAIINIILGTNLSGDEKACLINKHCDSSYGELNFTDNNRISHTIIRGKNKYNNKGNFLILDGKPISQTDLIDYYKDKKLFLSIINPLYFLNKKSAEQKELVDKYLSNIKPKEIFDKLSKSQQEKLLKKYYHDENKPYTNLSSEEQENFINLKMSNICMDIAFNNLSKNEKSILEGVPKDIPTYIYELNGDIKTANSMVSSLDGKIEYAQNIVNEEIPQYKTFDKEEELLLVRQELVFLNMNQDIVDKEKQKQIVETLEKEILSKETELKQIETSMKAGKKKYLDIKNGNSCVCPTCNQHIQDESKNITIANMKKELISFYDKKNLLETQIKDLKFNLTIGRCKYHALDGNATIEKSKRISVVEETINKLEKEKSDIDKFNNEIAIKEKTVRGAKIDIEKFNLEKQARIELINTLNQAKKIAQKLYINYIEEKMKLAKEYLKDVNIKFYSVLKTTGEIREDFVIMYKNTPLTDLSRSETIATALEFANMFNKISKSNFPIFIDDYESCADYDFISEYAKDTQIIISKVEKGHLLTIADNNNKNLTVIKPIIKGFKKINNLKLTKNNVAQLQQVA